MNIEKIYVFGCPRSGTTYVKKWIEVSCGDNVIVEKISEASIYHPIADKNGMPANGLIELSKNCKSLFIYVHRSDEGIKSSFESARYVFMNHVPQKINTVESDLSGFASVSNDRINDMIKATKINTKKQRSKIDIITIKYDHLSEEEYVNFLCFKLSKYTDVKSDFHSWHKKKWMKAPVRAGALSHGLQQNKP